MLDQLDREPGQPGAAGEGDEAGGTEPQHRDDARGIGIAQLLEDRRERRAGVVLRRGGRPVEVDPREACEFSQASFAPEQGMTAPGDDARSEFHEALAPEEPGQRLVRVDAPAVHFRLASGKAPQSLGARGALDPELDGGEGLPEPGRRLGEHGLDPGRRRSDPEDAGAARTGGVDGLLGVISGAENPPCMRDRPFAERGRAHAVGQPFEQAPAEPGLKPGDIAGERGLGDVAAVRGKADPSGFGDGDQPRQVGASLEHCGVSPASVPAHGQASCNRRGDLGRVVQITARTQLLERRHGIFAMRGTHGSRRDRHSPWGPRIANGFDPLRDGSVCGGRRRAGNGPWRNGSGEEPEKMPIGMSWSSNRRPRPGPSAAGSGRPRA